MPLSVIETRPFVNLPPVKASTTICSPVSLSATYNFSSLVSENRGQVSRIIQK